MVLELMKETLITVKLESIDLFCTIRHSECTIMESLNTYCAPCDLVCVTIENSHINLVDLFDHDLIFRQLIKDYEKDL